MTTPFPFVSGAVLTAAQLNAITEVPVSAKTASYTLAATDAGSRITMSSASATTITVNTALFTAGQSLRIQNLNAGGVCTVTAGTATVTSAGPLAIPAWGGGQLYFTSSSAAVWFPDAATTTSGLVCVKAETSFSAAATVTADSIFTSSYTNYLLQFTSTCATNQNITLQLRAAGVTATAANYNDQSINASSTTVTAARSASATSFDIQTSSASSLYNYTQVTFFQPQLARATGFGALSTYNGSGSYAQPIRQDWFGNHTVATAYDGFIISVSGSETLTGSYSVYGYSKTV
jgi:hypothetical protein